MRRTKAGVVLILAAVAVLALSGCGAMTPEKLTAKIQQAVEKTPYSQAEMDMALDMTMAEPSTGIEVDLGIQMGGQMQMSYDPDTVYENLEIAIEMLGIRMPTNLEIYILPEEDGIASYTNIGGMWTRAELDAVPQTGEGLSIALWDLPPEQLSIDEDVTELEGDPAICLTGQVTGQDVAQAVEFLLGNLEESESMLDEDMLIREGQGDVDWEQVTAQVSAYVDPKTFLPLREEISIEGLDQALAGQLESAELSVSVQNASMTVDYTSYEPAQPCTLPEGAKAAVEQTQRLLEGNPDNGDGTFTIQESGYYVDITAPEGYELEYTNYDAVEFYNPELDRRVCYQMWMTVDSNDLFFWDMMAEESYQYKGGDDGSDPWARFRTADTDDFAFCVDDFEYQGACKGRNFYAWANLDDEFYSWILVKVYDGGDTQDTSLTEEELQGLLELVSTHQSPTTQEEMKEILEKLDL